ncbi:MAG TPA: hypothetical protein VKZ89_19025 [Thermobifida alba]|nr:hypothetical protein [Thermobifida alba]
MNHPLLTLFHTRSRSAARGDAGYSTEAIVVIALLVGLAIAAFAVVTPAVTDKANQIVDALSE